MCAKSSEMSTPRFARGSKSRLFLYIGVITVAGVIVYFFHHAQIELYDYQKKSEKCLQQQESLSAQFQVIIEYKVRLEKSLQQEKSEHRKLREELQGKLDEEKQLREKENLENINKFTSLQQQFKILQSHNDDLKEECGRLRVTQLQGLDAQSKLETALQAAKQDVQNVKQMKDKEMQHLKNEYLQLEAENSNLKRQNKELTENGRDNKSNMYHLQKEVIQLNNSLRALKGELVFCKVHSTSPVRIVGADGFGVANAPKASSVPNVSSSIAVIPNLQVQVLQEPRHDHVSVDKVSHMSQKSTTPQINPDAVLSREKAIIAAAPMGVVAPDSPGKEPTPSGAAGSSRKEVAAAAAVGAAPPAAGGGGDSEGAAAAAAGEGALQAPNWEPPNEIPNQPPFDAQAGGGGGFLRGEGAGVGPAPPGPLALRPPNVPAGVVPAPHGYGLDRDEANGINQDGDIMEDPWHWRRSKAWVAPAVGAVGESPRRRQLAEPRHAPQEVLGNIQRPEGIDVAEEREKEIPRQHHHPYAEYNGDNGEYEKERQGDLQLEEGEEEEDDDVDQIDYANDNGNGAETRQKHLNPKDLVLNVNKHDSVMVNPK